MGRGIEPVSANFVAPPNESMPMNAAFREIRLNRVSLLETL